MLKVRYIETFIFGGTDLCNAVDNHGHIVAVENATEYAGTVYNFVFWDLSEDIAGKIASAAIGWNEVRTLTRVYLDLGGMSFEDIQKAVDSGGVEWCIFYDDLSESTEFHDESTVMDSIERIGFYR